MTNIWIENLTVIYARSSCVFSSHWIPAEIHFILIGLFDRKTHQIKTTTTENTLLHYCFRPGVDLDFLSQFFANVTAWMRDWNITELNARSQNCCWLSLCDGLYSPVCTGSHNVRHLCIFYAAMCWACVSTCVSLEVCKRQFHRQTYRRK